MPKQLKVYGWLDYVPGYDHQAQAIIATTSQRQAALQAHTEVNQIKTFSFEPNEADERVALSEPGTVFWRPVNDPTSWYRKGQAYAV